MKGPYASGLYLPWPTLKDIDTISDGDPIHLKIDSLFKIIELWECENCSNITLRKVTDIDSLLFPVPGGKDNG
jgi:hypothetical protein